MTERRESSLGAFYALSAYLWWGFFPLYFKQVAEAGIFEIMAHRIFWSAVCMAALALAMGNYTVLRALFATPRRLAWLALSSTCVAITWFIFAWAVIQSRVVETSLGYFINPLVSVLLGRVFLGEQLRPAQAVAVLMACAAVLWLVLAHGAFPWIAFSLAASFGAYGLLRKQIPIDPVTGLLVETALMTPAALLCFVWLLQRGDHLFSTANPGISVWLMLGGPVTTIPLLLFAAGVRRIQLATLGFLQYVSPTITFLLAIFLYREPFDLVRLAAFCVIWTALALFSVDTFRAARRMRNHPLQAPVAADCPIPPEGEDLIG